MPRKFEPREVVLPEKKIPAEAKDEVKKDSQSAQKGKGGAAVDSAGDEKVQAKADKTPEPVERPPMKLDTVLTDRTAMLIRRDSGLPVFELDALGFSGAEASLTILPLRGAGIDRTASRCRDEPDEIQDCRD